MDAWREQGLLPRVSLAVEARIIASPRRRPDAVVCLPGDWRWPVVEEHRDVDHAVVVPVLPGASLAFVGVFASPRRVLTAVQTPRSPLLELLADR